MFIIIWRLTVYLLLMELTFGTGQLLEL